MLSAYKTIEQPIRVKSAVGSCRFYASVTPCVTEGEARRFLEQVKEELPGATHHAFAFRLGVGDSILARSDDAGEPAGTAGSPMLGVLEKYDLTNLMLVGTRYFGGVKLGIGGLVRAYRACAESGIQGASICQRELQARIILRIPYDYLGAAVQQVESLQGKVVDFIYGQEVTLEILIPQRWKDDLLDQVASVCKGNVRVDSPKDQ